MRVRLPSNLGIVLLGIWLLLTGLLGLVNIGIPGIGTIMALLALVAGILLLIGR